MAAVLRLYQAHFDAYPLLTIAAANSSLTALGDIVAQTGQMIVRTIFLRNLLILNDTQWPGPSPRLPSRPRWHGLDLERTMRFAAFGALMGPVLGRWNIFLEKYLPLRSLGESALGQGRALGKRVLADQIVMCAFLLITFDAALLNNSVLIQGANRGACNAVILGLLAFLTRPNIAARNIHRIYGFDGGTQVVWHPTKIWSVLFLFPILRADGSSLLQLICIDQHLLQIGKCGPPSRLVGCYLWHPTLIH